MKKLPAFYRESYYKGQLWLAAVLVLATLYCYKEYVCYVKENKSGNKSAYEIVSIPSRSRSTRKFYIKDRGKEQCVFEGLSSKYLVAP